MPIYESALDFHIIATFAIIALAMLSYVLDRLPIEVTSLAALVALLALFYLFPLTDAQGTILLDGATLMSGFANPVLFTLLGLILIGQAMFHSGSIGYIAGPLLRNQSKYPQLMMVIIFAVIFLFSAVLNNTPVVVMFIPIITALAQNLPSGPRRFLMPLSFLSIFGGMTTLVGSSTNLLASGIYAQHFSEPMRFFDLAPLALLLGGAGIVYIIAFSGVLLPRKSTNTTSSTPTHGRQFIARLVIRADTPLHGAVAKAGFFPDLKNMTLRLITRGSTTYTPPFDLTLRSGDVLTVAATRKELTECLRANRGYLPDTQIKELFGDEKSSPDLTTVEAIVAPNTRIRGRSIAQLNIAFQTGCELIGILRRSRMIREPLEQIRLEPGDVLLLLGTPQRIKSLRGNLDYLLLEWSMQHLPEKRKAIISLAVFVGTLLLIATGITPPYLAALGGTVAILLSGCINLRLAKRSIDSRIVTIIGASLAMGLALEKTGGAAFLAGQFVAFSSQLNEVWLIAFVFAVSAAMTNVLSNNASVILLTPIAIEAALRVGFDPLVLVITCILGCNCSFATPISYQTNLLVMAPGDYRFRDYVLFGLPLTLLLWAIYSVAAPWYFNKMGML